MAASLDLSLPPAQAILQYYQTCLALHGDTAKGAGWPSDEDRNERFKTLLDIVLSCRTGSRSVVWHRAASQLHTAAPANHD
jgi:hypothetical protein